MIKFCLMCAVFFTSISTLSAAPYTEKDFAYSATLSEANTSLREIKIPLELYQKMKRSDYGDLRLFNADGQMVPHQFSHQTPHKNIDQNIPLVFYPLSQKEAKNASNIQVIISQKSKEHHIRVDQSIVDPSIVNQTPQKQTEYQYIIENKKHSPLLCKLELDWTTSQPNSVISFTLESSNQLQKWTTLSHKLTLSKLNYGGSQLIHNQVDFSCTSQKYLRLTWLKPEQSIHLTQIKGIYTYKNKQKTHWINAGKPALQKNEQWLFESPVIAKISKIELIAPRDGLLYKGILYSRNHKKDKWRYQAEVNQYQLNIGKSSLQSSPLTFTPTNDRYWKIDLKTESQLTPNQLPDIKMGWAPKQLHFLAQGNDPFKIAFGHPTLKPPHNNSGLSDLIKSIQQSGASIDHVQIKEIISNNKTFKPERNIQWKLISLWFVLISGTLLMGWMAYRLYQQMGGGKK